MIHNWNKIINELIRLKKAGIPVETRVQHRKNWIQEVTKDYVVVQRDESGNDCTITRSEFENGTMAFLKKRRKSAITRALRELSLSCDSTINEPEVKEL